MFFAARCIRACDELVANHTLGLGQRGSESMVRADANIPLGESSCISCGTCTQVCPTGALFYKRSAFMGKDSLTQKVKSTCNQCGIGCGTEVVTRGGNILCILGDWDAPVNKGLLCKMGRFEPLYDSRKRLTEPLLRTKEKFRRNKLGKSNPDSGKTNWQCQSAGNRRTCRQLFLQ